MSPEFRDEESESFKDGQNWGLSCTELFGMVSGFTKADVPNAHQVMVGN
jgi:hypothetical protein